MTSSRMKRDFKMFLDSCSLFAVESVGVLSLAISFLAMILVVEFAFHMKLVLKQQSLVPAFSTQLLFRELGPVVTCLLLASRIGASLAAEIATMKGSQQLDALKSFGGRSDSVFGHSPVIGLCLFHGNPHVDSYGRSLLRVRLRRIAFYRAIAGGVRQRDVRLF